MAIVIATVLILLAIIIYASYVENDRYRDAHNNLAKLNRTLEMEIKIRNDDVSSTRTGIGKLARDTNEEFEKREKKIEATFAAVRKEIEMLQVRQRTLEKKLIPGERTINLVISEKSKSKSTGRGKSALFPENSI